MSKVRYQTLDVIYQIPYVAYQMANVEFQMSDVKYQFSDERYSISDGQFRSKMSDVKKMNIVVKYFFFSCRQSQSTLLLSVQ